MKTCLKNIKTTKFNKSNCEAQWSFNYLSLDLLISQIPSANLHENLGKKKIIAWIAS